MNLLNRGKIKGSESLSCLHISADGTITHVDLPIRRQFVMDDDGRQAWGITRRLRKYRGRMTQIIHEESCAPQHTKNETKWVNENIANTIKEIYHDTKYTARLESKRNFTAELVKFAIGAVVLLTLIGMMFG